MAPNNNHSDPLMNGSICLSSSQSASELLYNKSNERTHDLIDDVRPTLKLVSESESESDPDSDSELESLNDSNQNFSSTKTTTTRTTAAAAAATTNQQKKQKQKQARTIWHTMQQKQQQRNTNNNDSINTNYNNKDMIISSSSSSNKTNTNTCIDPMIFKTLSSIRILNNDPNNINNKNSNTNTDAHTNNNKISNKAWLQSHNGKLDILPNEFIHEIKQCAPQNFNAYVADFNDNLYYDMQDQYGLNHLLQQQQQSTNIKKKSTPTRTINPDEILQRIVKTKQYLGSYLATESTTPQPPHVDFTWERLEADGNDLRIGFFPLTNEGMFLQIWSRNDKCVNDHENEHDHNQPHDNIHYVSRIEGEVIYIPYGYLLTLPATTIHGGGFRTTEKRTMSRTASSTLPSGTTSNNSSSSSSKSSRSDHGNLRFHLYIANNDTQLSKSQTTNKYTEPGDKRKELADRYVDAPGMDDLMEYFFVSNI